MDYSKSHRDPVSPHQTYPPSLIMPDLPIALLCPVLIWVMLVGFFLSVCFAMRDSMARLKRLHQIPCSRCDFFTGDYRLKCTVHPCKVMSEDAIGCLDYEPASCEKVGRSPTKSTSRCA